MHSPSLMLRATALAVILSASPVAAAHAADGNAEAGRTAFNRRCVACHAPTAGQNKVGPSLYGVVGRPSGQAPGFNYSPSMRAASVASDALSSAIV